MAGTGIYEYVGNSIAKARQTYLQQFNMSGNAKHCIYSDYGYPEHPDFYTYYNLYKHNGLARAIVKRPVEKTWQDYPWLLIGEPPHKETADEKRIREALDRLAFWRKLSEADEKSRVGEYAGIILRFADNQDFDQPVDRVPGGLDGLVGLIPVFEEQLIVSEYDYDTFSATYGQPLMYQFIESATESERGEQRSFMVHPDRVHIWSETGSVHGDDSCLEACLNALLDYEKVRGAGGAGFWKNAKAAPIFQAKEGDVLRSSAQAQGMTIQEFLESLDDSVDDYNKGFDASLLLQAMEATFPNISLADPTPFMLGYIQEAAATVPIPVKELLGSQSGERASTEDGNRWAETIMARREQVAKPNIMRLVAHLVRVGVLLDRDYRLDWSDLTESSMDEKIARAEKMATINKALLGTGVESPFTQDEIREAVGYEPLTQPVTTEELDDE